MARGPLTQCCLRRTAVVAYRPRSPTRVREAGRLSPPNQGDADVAAPGRAARWGSAVAVEQACALRPDPELVLEILEALAEPR